jgi:hypothetical protein
MILSCKKWNLSQLVLAFTPRNMFFQWQIRGAKKIQNQPRPWLWPRSNHTCPKPELLDFDTVLIFYFRKFWRISSSHCLKWPRIPRPIRLYTGIHPLRWPSKGSNGAGPQVAAAVRFTGSTQVTISVGLPRVATALAGPYTGSSCCSAHRLYTGNHPIRGPSKGSNGAGWPIHR